MENDTTDDRHEGEQDLVETLRQIALNVDGEFENSYDWKYNFQRWLNAYDDNVDAITPLLQAAVRLRRTMCLNRVTLDNVDEHRRRLNANMQRYYPGGLCGYDKRGNVVVVEPTGRCDPRGLLTVGRCSDFVAWRLLEAENILLLIRRQEEKMHKKCGLLLIMDLEGLTSEQIYMPTMTIYTTIITLIQHTYPDMLWKLLIIKAPAVMNVAYRIVLPFLNKKTRDKLEIVPGDTWRSKLADLVDADQLPVHWGGTVGGGEYGDYGTVRPGGKVPAEAASNMTHASSPCDLVNLTINRGSVERVAFRLEQKSAVSWFFFCPSGDVGFGIDRKDGDQRGKYVVPHFRLNTEVVPEYGTLDIVEVGHYELVFDNSYSWLRSKTVSYCIQIKPLP